MPELSDNQLVEQCLGGDNKAFDVLVNRYILIMYRTSLGILNDSDLANDATQAGFIKAWEKLSTYNPDYKFYSWLYRIIVNETLNAKRGKKKHLELVQVESEEDTPFQELVRKEEYSSLDEALQSLSDDYKIVIQLKHLEGLSYKEIAEILNIDTKTVKSRLYSARMQLRKILL